MATKRSAPISPATAPKPANIVAELPFLTPQRIKLFSIAGGALLAIVAAVWFFVELGNRKEAFAADEVTKARAAAEQGNLGGAASQFEQIVKGYRGTRAAYDASIGLAQVKLIAEQNEGAVETVLNFLKENPPATYGAPANGLLGTAYENLGKFDEAAAAYLKAAELADVPYLKVSSLLDAARASRIGGKKDEAVKILTDLIAKYPDVPGHVEAELQLGEITGGSKSE